MQEVPFPMECVFYRHRERTGEGHRSGPEGFREIYVGRTSPFDVALSALQETNSPWVHDMIVSKIN